VLPATAAADLSDLRRYCRLRRDDRAVGVLTASLVRQVVTAAGAHCKREKSPKHPILISHIDKFLRSDAIPGRDAAQQRDGAMLLVGLLFGFRRAELVKLTFGDATWVERALRLRVVSDKTNASTLGVHHARYVSSAHTLLDEFWPAYAERFLEGARASDPLFPKLDVHGLPTTAPLAAASVTAAVKRAAGPGFSAHSLRVGCASELFRAGVPLATIKEIGRWRSDAALLYVIPAADMMSAAGRSMGTPKVSPWVACAA
jgi:integrase